MNPSSTSDFTASRFVRESGVAATPCCGVTLFGTVARGSRAPGQPVSSRSFNNLDGYGYRSCRSSDSAGRSLAFGGYRGLDVTVN